MSSSRSVAWLVWMVASIFYAYQYILRVIPNSMLGDIMHQFNIDSTIFGQFSGVYYIGYAMVHLPIGIMLDRYGPKIVMPWCILLTVIGLLPLTFSQNWIYAVIGRMLIGVGSSAAILGTFKIIRMNFKEQHFTRMLSFSVTIGLIGAIYGGGPVNYMKDVFGHKIVIQIFSFIGVILTAVTYFMVPKITHNPTESVSADLKKVLTNGRVVALCCCAGLMVGPLEGFADVWGSEFLKQVYGFNKSIACYIPSMIFIGMCFGSPILSFIAEKTNNYLGAIIGAGFIMMISFILLVFQLLTKNSMILVFILVGMCSAYQIIAICKASTYVSEHVAGLTTAIANMIIMSFGYAFHAVIGFIINIYGGPTASKAFIYGITVIPFTLGIGTLGFLLFYYQEKRYCR